MKKLIMFSPPLVFVICMVLLCACHESDNEQILDQLDQVIESKGLYAVRFERRVDSLRRELCTASDDTMRWRTANLANAIIDRISHDSYCIDITSINAKHDISMREFYGLGKTLRQYTRI